MKPRMIFIYSLIMLLSACSVGIESYRGKLAAFQFDHFLMGSCVPGKLFDKEMEWLIESLQRISSRLKKIGHTNGSLKKQNHQ